MKNINASSKDKVQYNLDQTKIANSAKQSLDLSVDDMQLTKVESERVLGVYIDSHLIWNEHIDTLRRKLLQRIAIAFSKSSEIYTNQISIAFL